MLHLLITRTKIVAGFESDQQTELLSFDGEPFLSYPGQSPIKAIDQYFPALVSAYRAVSEAGNHQPIPLAMALPVDISSSDRAQVRQTFLQTKSPAFALLHEDNLAVAFLMGLVAEGRMEAKSAVLLEAIEHHTNVCFFQPAPTKPPEQWLADEHAFVGESFEHHLLKDFGPVAGNEKVLSELLRSFTEAGLKVDFKGQTDLALQLERAESPFRFQINQETERVTLAGEVRLTDAEYEQLMTSNRERLLPHLREGNLKQNQVAGVALVGSFLYQDSILRYLRHDLKLGERLIDDVPQDDEAMFGVMIAGLAERSARVKELMRLRKAEEERRAKIEAEIKTKEGREQLMARLASTCVDPNQKEAYEAEFVPLAIGLGIPEVVIKWNISEALSRVSLEEEALKAGLKEERSPKSLEPKKQESPSSPPVANGQASSRATANGKQKERTPKAEPKPRPEPVGVAAGNKPKPVSAAKPQPKDAPSSSADTEDKNSDQSRKKPALNAIFLLNGTISGEEFPTRRATFKGDSVVKLVRLLPLEKQDDKQVRKHFEALYTKEKTYYGPLGEISELSEAKEGIYYFRDYIERNTLKEYITRMGLDKKQKVEDLSSEDLKFILQVFKSVQELPVTHARLNENNILVLNKRRGLLRRGGQAEIRFTGFTSEESTQEQMINATHQAFSRLMGQKFYTEFRKQFQL
jgi:hypothetical protein